MRPEEALNTHHGPGALGICPDSVQQMIDGLLEAYSDCPVLCFDI
jgi:hypothetical protein